MKICECGGFLTVIDVSVEEAPLTPGEYEHADRCRLTCSCGKKSIVYIGGYQMSARSALESDTIMLDHNGDPSIQWEFNPAFKCSCGKDAECIKEMIWPKDGSYPRFYDEGYKFVCDCGKGKDSDPDWTYFQAIQTWKKINNNIKE